MHPQQRHLAHSHLRQWHLIVKQPALGQRALRTQSSWTQESLTSATNTQTSPKQISSTGILDGDIITLGIKHRNPADRHPKLKNLPPGDLANRRVQKVKETFSTLRKCLQRFIVIMLCTWVSHRQMSRAVNVVSGQKWLFWWETVKYAVR